MSVKEKSSEKKELVGSDADEILRLGAERERIFDAWHNAALEEVQIIEQRLVDPDGGIEPREPRAFGSAHTIG